MSHNKTAVISMMVLSLAFQSLDAVARVGGSRSGSSMSSNRSYASQPSVAPQRAGGGNDAGMQRPEVMNKARTQESTAPATQTALQPASPTTTAAQPAKPGYGVGTVVGAAAAGAAVGYLANSAMHDAPLQNQSGGTDSYSNPLGTSNHGNNSSSSPWGAILMLLAGAAAIMGVLMYLSRRREAAEQLTHHRAAQPEVISAPIDDTEKQAFERDALKFFNDLQDANNRGDITYIENNSIDPIRQQLVEDIRHRTTASRTQIMMMKSERIDLTDESNRSIASVRFRGMVSENENAASDNIDEVWHFVRFNEPNNRWLLAGIEQV